MKRLALFALIVAAAGCHGDRIPDYGTLIARRSLASGQTIFSIDGNGNISTGARHYWCPESAAAVTPSVREGDLVRFYSDSCTDLISDFDTSPDGTTVKR